MGIIKGAISFGSNFNIGVKGPIDSRMRVGTIADLTTVWGDAAPAYQGMIVAVIETGSLYVLKTEDPTSLDNWKKIDTDNQAEVDAKLDKVISDVKVLVGDDTDKSVRDISKDVRSELGLKYDSTAKTLSVIAGNTVIGDPISVTDFVKDGMLVGEALYTATGSDDKVTISGKEYTLTGLTAGSTYIVMVWNDDGPKDPMCIDVTTLANTYAAGDGLKLTGNTFSLDTSKITELIAADTTVTGLRADVNANTDAISGIKTDTKINGTAVIGKDTKLDGSTIKITDAAKGTYVIGTDVSLDTAIKTLDTAVKNNAEAIAGVDTGVISIGGEKGELTFADASTTAGDINLSVSDAGVIGATIVGLGSAAYAEAGSFATSAQGIKADSALQTVSASTGSDFLSVSVAAKTDNSQAITIGATVTKDLTNYDKTEDDDKSLVSAGGVKSYVDTKIGDIDFTPYALKADLNSLSDKVTANAEAITANTKAIGTAKTTDAVATGLYKVIDEAIAKEVSDRNTAIDNALAWHDL